MIKKVEILKESNNTHKMKEYNIGDIANTLKYEFHQKNTVVTDLGNIAINYLYGVIFV